MSRSKHLYYPVAHDSRRGRMCEFQFDCAGNPNVTEEDTVIRWRSGEVLETTIMTPARASIAGLVRVWKAG
jgi:hypothetical protein